MRRGKMRALFNVATMVALGAGLLVAGEAHAVAQLRQTPFEDGTGSIGLAPGWRIDSVYRGKVTCVGPHGAGVVLGLPWPIVKAEDAAIRTLPSTAQQPIAQTGDVVGALKEVLQKKFGATLRSVSGNPAPQAFRGVPAYYLLYEFEQNGRMFTGLGYFTTLQYGPTFPAWELYSSVVVAPREQFPQLLQTMLHMWRSWRPNGQEPNAGSNSALIDNILRERQLSHERISREFRKLL